MKKDFLSYFAAALVSALIISTCGKQQKFKDLEMGRRDSTKTVGAFVGYQLKSKHWGDMWRITFDTIGLIANKDSSNFKKGLTRITWYSANVPIVVDSAFAVAFKVPLLDSAGKPNVVRFSMDILPQYVVDASQHTDFDLDTALVYLDKFVIKDSITKK